MKVSSHKEARNEANNKRDTKINLFENEKHIKVKRKTEGDFRTFSKKRSSPQHVQVSVDKNSNQIVWEMKQKLETIEEN